MRSKKPLEDPHVNKLPNALLTNAQLTKRSQNHKQAQRESQLHLLNATKKLSRLMRNLSLAKRAMLLISKNDIPGCKRVLETALSRGASPGVVLSKLEDALAGVYKARGWNETDDDLALMVLRLGGPALLHVLHQTSGLPSLTYTRNLGRKVCSSKVVVL